MPIKGGSVTAQTETEYMSNLTLPIIHRNGTSVDDLRAGYDAAATHLHDFIESFNRIEFNARDYYVSGPETFQKAQSERQAIEKKANEIHAYLQTIREHLYA